MGAEHSKNPEVQEALGLLSSEEGKDLAGAFRQLAHPGTKGHDTDMTGTFDIVAFHAFTRKVLPEQLARRLHQAMCESSAEGDRDLVDRDAFIISVARLTKGTLTQKCHYYVRLCADYSRGVEPTPTASQLHHVVCTLISIALHSRGLNPKVTVWGGSDPDANARLARVMLDQMLFHLKRQSEEESTEMSRVGKPLPDDVVFSKGDLETWLVNNSLVLRLFDHIFRSVFFAASDLAAEATDGREILLPLLPQVDGGVAERSLLDAATVLYLNDSLPMDCRHHWEQAFDTQRHGQSFATMLQKLEKVGGATVLVVEDDHGNVFGGFASAPWQVAPQYQGDNKCFLFSLRPGMGMWLSSGYNDHFMYLNHSMETMPNGLGMGGQHNYFGLWLDADFGSGQSCAEPHCTTYNSPCLSQEKDFRINRVEIWSVSGAPDRVVHSHGSVLDTQLDVQAMLAMVDKPMSGVYEPVEDPINKDD